MSTPTRARWEEVPLAPGPDVVHQIDPLTVIQSMDRGDQVILLPPEEDQLLEDEFMVIDESAIKSLESWR